ncbi:MAG: hypothetical protein V9G12_01580 [Microthrixaceae bacterium]
MLLDARADYDPVAILDDDRFKKRRLRLSGVPVQWHHRGPLESRPADRRDDPRRCDHSSRLGKSLEWDREASAAGMTACRVIPSTKDIVGGAVKLGDISEVTEEDLLGRRPIQTDESGIGHMLTGRRVLITGAGGSIGSELPVRFTATVRPTSDFSTEMNLRCTPCR